MTTRTEDYLDLPYHVEIVRSESPEDGDAGWVAEVRELNGCIALGRRPDELLANVRSAMEAWIDDARETGDPPLPHADPLPSGKLLLRMPRSLHASLAGAAEREGVSLNEYVVALLAAAAGSAWDAGADITKRRPAQAG
jgi:predicted RNase H-like HicB family nuclease